MKFNLNQQDLQQALSYCQGVIEKRSTLPILSNILMEVQKYNLTITATDLDLIFIHKLNNVEILEEGKGNKLGKGTSGLAQRRLEIPGKGRLCLWKLHS